MNSPENIMRMIATQAVNYGGAPEYREPRLPTGEHFSNPPAGSPQWEEMERHARAWNAAAKRRQISVLMGLLRRYRDSKKQT